MKKKYIVSALIGVLVGATCLFFNRIEVSASNVNSENGLVIKSVNGEDEGIFSKKDGLWQSGEEKFNDFLVENNGNSNLNIRKIALKHINLSNYEKNRDIKEFHKEYKELMDNSFITIKDKDEELYKSTLGEAIKEDVKALKHPLNLKSKEYKNLKIGFKLSEKVSNNIQALKEEFQLVATYDKDINKDENKINTSGDLKNTESLKDIFLKMPKTGQVIGSMILILLGVISLILGVIFIRKSKEKKKLM